MSADDPRPTAATVDRRVERLETQVGAINTSLAALNIEQAHLRELMTIRFASVEAMMSSQASKLDTFINKIDLMIQQGQADPGANNAVARAALRKLDHTAEKVEQLEGVLDRVQGGMVLLRSLTGSSLVGLVASVFGIVYLVINGGPK